MKLSTTFQRSYMLVFAVLQLSSSTTAATTSKVLPTNQDVKLMKAQQEFMTAMRNSNHLTDNERKVRSKQMYQTLFSRAIPVQQQGDFGRNLGYYNNNGQDDKYENYGFDIANYSLKYAGCSSIATYSDEMAQSDYDSVLEIDKYAIFRFCPSNSCSDTSSYGCMSDYGEYMLPLDDWLEIIDEYRKEEFERYCEYCAAVDGNRRRLQYYDDAADDAAAVDDDAGDDDANAAAGDDEVAVDYSSGCSSYADVCEANVKDYSYFFDCVEFGGDDDGNVLYVGPHCKSDKTTIVLGVFSDEYCTIYVGDKYDLSTLTGLSVNDGTLYGYYSQDCISCNEKKLKYQAESDDDNVDNITEVCETLYDAAAKCNRHIGGATNKSYQSYQQDDSEYLVCSFINSVVSGTYDEFGYIYINAASYSQDNKGNAFAEVHARKQYVTTSQTHGLVFLSLIVCSLFLYAVVLNSKVQEKGLRSSPSQMTSMYRAPAISGRQNSGILMNRSLTSDSASGFMA